MLGVDKFVRKIFGTQNDRELKRLAPVVQRVNSLEDQFVKLSDAELKAKTGEYKQRIDNGESLDSLLPEAFATVREAGKRILNMRHFDVQLIGGTTLHNGRIAEMKTGEGKTLVATLPCYLNALSGKGVHVVTVNDYLAKRDAEWMGQLHRFLGLKVGIIVHGLNDRERKENYAADITYGTNNEYGFDYLRDNMKFRLEDYVQRELNFAIVDEVDSILIDEARTPLIISGPAEASTDLYYKIDREILADGGLNAGDDYTVEEKSKTAALNEAGIKKMEERLGVSNLYDPKNIELLHHVNQALRAHVLFKKDVDYVVRDGEVMIVDEFTGRLMPGRRWSDGLHQAIEAKEGVQIENENQTLATITFQNYFRMYNKLSGMTGTADTEATEFKQIYKLDVTAIPTNKPMIRDDQADMIFKTEDQKINAIVDQIREVRDKGQPCLVGTISVEKSEVIAQRLKKEGIAHHVLNAKQHAKEADVVAQAGQKGSVTIATNMAGRGTDIVLGGNAEVLARAEVGSPHAEASDEELKNYRDQLQEATERWQAKSADEQKEVKEAGGLFILGTERHESRRIDNQLRGRAGRQGDPGASRFFISLDDDLMRIFGGMNIKRFMEDDMVIEHRLINRAIANAQKKVEAHNYDIRKHLLQYDDVMNQQRKVVYAWRREVLGNDNLRDMVFFMVEELAEEISQDFFPNGKLPKRDGAAYLDSKELNDAIAVTFQIRSSIEEKDIEPLNDRGLKKLIMKLAESAYSTKESELGTENLRQIEKVILLQTIDGLWKDHLLAMDHLREGIGLRGYGQKDPLVEYKKEGFRFFEMMMKQITGDVVRKAFAVQMAERPGSNLAAEMMDELTDELDVSNMEFNLSADGSLISKNNQLPPPGQPTPEQLEAMNAMGPGAGGPGFGGPPQGARRLPTQQQNIKPVESGVPKVGRNDPCPCGSGKKYKKCHGR